MTPAAVGRLGRFAGAGYGARVVVVATGVVTPGTVAFGSAPGTVDWAGTGVTAPTAVATVAFAPGFPASTPSTRVAATGTVGAGIAVVEVDRFKGSFDVVVRLALVVVVALVFLRVVEGAFDFFLVVVVFFAVGFLAVVFFTALTTRAAGAVFADRLGAAAPDASLVAIEIETITTVIAVNKANNWYGPCRFSISETLGEGLGQNVSIR